MWNLPVSKRTRSPRWCWPWNQAPGFWTGICKPMGDFKMIRSVFIYSQWISFNPQKSKHKVKKKKSKLAVALLHNKLASSTPLSSVLGGATDLTFHLYIQSMDLTLVHNLMEWCYQWKSVAVKLRVAKQVGPANVQYVFCFVASPSSLTLPGWLCGREEELGLKSFSVTFWINDVLTL